MPLDAHKALYGSGYSRKPYKDKERPAPIAVLAQRNKRYGRVAAGYMPVDGGMVPLAQLLLPRRPCRQGMVYGGRYVARQHTEEIQYDACRGPAIARPATPHEEDGAHDKT